MAILNIALSSTQITASKNDCKGLRRKVNRLNKETLINKVSEALYENRGAIFVGSGISAPSAKVDWFRLLSPFTEDLGIKLDNNHDDLPLIAQYIVNEYTGNRGPLVNVISKEFNKNLSMNNYHVALAATKVGTIWTTNYDTLLEKAFSDFLIDVKVNDDSISRNVVNSDIEILKVHGCISRSHHDEIVITQEDYDDFLTNKPAIAQRLCNDLLKLSFLFIGYSYRDHNIKNVMIASRRLAKNTTQEHYLITTAPKDRDPDVLREKKRRQELWQKDLKRLGVSTLEIENHKELETILFAISRKSRGKTVYVTGSHEKGSPVAQQLGEFLAIERDITLVSGQSAGIGSDVVSAFTERCIRDQHDINGRIQLFSNPYAANPNFSNDPALLPELKKCRAKLMNGTHVVLAFSGGMGTEAELEVAKSRNCRIIPVVLKDDLQQNQVIEKLLEDKAIVRYLKEIDPEYYSKLQNGGVSSEDIIGCVRRIFK